MTSSPASDVPLMAVNLPQARQHLFGVELEEAVLLAAGLADVHLVEPGVGVGPDTFQVVLDAGPVGRGDVAFRDQLAQLAELPGQRSSWTASPGIWSVRHSRCMVLRAVPASGPQQTFSPPCTGRSPPPESR